MVAAVVVAWAAQPVVEVRLREEAEVATRYVPFTAVADGAGVPADLWRALDAIYLGPAPDGDAERVIGRDFIVRVLRRHHLSDGVVIRGGAVRVRRARAPEADRIVALRAEIERLVAEAMGPGAGRVECEVDPASLEDWPQGVRIAEVHARSAPRLGFGVYDCRLETGDGVSEWRTARATVYAVREVAVARRRIPADRELSEADFTVRAMRCDGREGYVGAEEAMGARAVQAIEAGTLLRRDLLRPRLLVRRNQTVFVRGDGFQVTARALQDGGESEWVEIMYPQTNVRARARVVGHGAVEVER
jgi:flagella basal body P-ring formation protein FlgA